MTHIGNFLRKHIHFTLQTYWHNLKWYCWIASERKLTGTITIEDINIFVLNSNIIENLIHSTLWRTDKFIYVFALVVRSYRFSLFRENSSRDIFYSRWKFTQKKTCFANNKPVNFMMMWVEVRNEKNPVTSVESVICENRPIFTAWAQEGVFQPFLINQLRKSSHTWFNVYT